MRVSTDPAVLTRNAFLPNSAKPSIFSDIMKALQEKPTLAEQKDTQAWQEIARQRGLGKTDSEIWFDAARKGDANIVGAFIRKPPQGFDINQKDVLGQTALHKAMLTQNLDLAKLLVNDGRIDMAALDNYGMDAHSIAAQYDKVASEKAIAGFLKGKLNDEALAAYKNGDDRRLQALIAAGADKIDPQKVTADLNQQWFSAVKNGDADKIREFIKNKPKGWDINAKDPSGETALQLATRGWVKGDSTAIVKLLVNEGRADLAVLDSSGRSALQIGTSLVEDSGLVGYKASVDFLKGKMNDEAQFASDRGDTKRIDALVAAGADQPIDYTKKLNDLDFKNNPTTEETDGKKLTVQELALKNLLVDLKDKISKGEIKEGSAAYKFYYAMAAQGDLSKGKDLLTHFEQQWAGTSSTTRGVGTDNVNATPKDMQGVIDADKVNNTIKDALSDPELSKQFNDALLKAAEKTATFDREKTKAGLKELLQSDGFRNHLKALQADGKAGQAKSELQRAISAYGSLASVDEVNAVTAEFTRDGIASELDNVLQHPDEIDQKYWEQSTADFIALSLSWTSSSIFFSQQLSDVARDPKLMELLKNRDFVKGFSEILKDYAKLQEEDRRAGRALTSGQNVDRLTQQIRDLAAKTFVSPLDKNLVTKYFDGLNKAGFLSTGAGVIALSSAIRKLTKGQGFGNDPVENMSIANGFMYYLATLTGQVNFVGLVGKYSGINAFMRMGSVSVLLGSENLQSMYKLGPAEVWKDLVAKQLKSVELPANLVKNGSGLFNNIAMRFGGPEAPLSDLKLKAATGALRVLAGISYAAFGVLDLVSGALGLKKAENASDIATGSLTVAAGVAWTGAGAAWAGATLGVEAAAPWVSRLGLVGAIFTVVGLVVTQVVVNQKENQKQVDYYHNLEKAGVLKEGWGDKLEFLTLYGYDKALPKVVDGESIFDKYDYKRWLNDYRKQNEGNNSTRPQIPDLHYNTEYGQPFENALNSAVSTYNVNIDTAGRTVPSMDGELKDQVSNLMEFYLMHEKRNATREEAADWAIGQIKGRLSGTYKSPDEGKRANDVLQGWLDQHGGRNQLVDIAQGILDRHPDILHPGAPEPDDGKKPPSNGGNMDWSKIH